MRGSIVLGVIALAGCTAAADPGPKGTRSFPVAQFDSVALGGAHDVIVHVGDAASVRAEGNQRALDNLVIRVDGQTLRIEDKPHMWSFGGRDDHATIYVTVPALTGVALGGSGNIRVDKASGPGFSASVDGSGDIEVGALQVASADFSIAGSGNISAQGQADHIKASVAGSGSIETPSMKSRTAEISITGSGNVALFASDTVAVNTVGSGDTTVHGPAKCSVQKLGSGEVHCGA